MFNYLIIVAAVIFSVLMIVSFFYGDFPFFSYNDDLTQAVCRVLLVFCNVLFITAVLMFPEASIMGPYVENAVVLNMLFAVVNVVLILIFEFFYWLGNIVVICAIGFLWYLCQKLAGWALKGDSEYFFDYYD